MAYKVFANGFTLNASELNTYLMNQSVMVFADSAARSTALTAPTEGMVTYLESTNALEFYNGTTWAIVGQDTTLTGVLITSPREKTTLLASSAGGTINFDQITQADLFYTSNAGGNWTLNVKGNGSTSLNTVMSTGETTTVVFRTNQGATPHYMTALTIDGNAQTVKWQGGTAPTAGNASSTDVYTFAITKTGSATFTVLGSLSKFA
jgi:hypothetical protein